MGIGYDYAVFYWLIDICRPVPVYNVRESYGWANVNRFFVFIDFWNFHYFLQILHVLLFVNVFQTCSTSSPSGNQFGGLPLVVNVTNSWLIATICGVIQNLGWTQFEYTSKTIIIAVENSSFV